jgi:hypothetical protein
MRYLFLVFLLFFSISQSGTAAEIGISIEVMPWDQANQFLPRYSKFTVLDTETGLSFQVQRRAGSNHADVQPLTKKDTAIMKKIYNGEWSWKRRAIVVQHNQKWIAASMHGMPHGAGALENNFPGHFCIHFYGSTTHRSNAMDLSHKLMVLKAAGILDRHLSSTDPYELVHSFIAGFKQQDKTILRLISLQKFKWTKYVEKVENVKLTRVYMLPAEDIQDELHISIPVEVEWHIIGKGKQYQKGEVHLLRFSPISPWKVDSLNFLNENSFLGSE